MSTVHGPDTLVAAVRLHHREDLGQVGVAVRLGTSRSNVSRTLTAVEQGALGIRVDDPVACELEDQLRRRAVAGAVHDRVPAVPLDDLAAVLTTAPSTATTGGKP